MSPCRPPSVPELAELRAHLSDSVFAMPGCVVPALPKPDAEGSLASRRTCLTRGTKVGGSAPAVPLLQGHPLEVGKCA
jgi:hypothetical protein